MSLFKFKKPTHLKGEKWKTHSLVGEALSGKLIEAPTETFCPQGVQDVINARTDDIYKMGFESAVSQIRDALIVIVYEEE